MILYAKDYVVPARPARPSVTGKQIRDEAKSYLETVKHAYLEELRDHLYETFPGVFTRAQWARKIKPWYRAYNPPTKVDRAAVASAPVASEG